MNTIGHSQFILSPISNIIRDTANACVSLGDGIESQPLASYIMQTTFLRMTGASEQKLKCICWEIASFDYEFRYELLKSPLGECSSYDDKKKIFSNICKCLRRYETSIELEDIEKDSIIGQATVELERNLDNSDFSNWFERDVLEYKAIRTAEVIKRNHFCVPGSNDSFTFLEKILHEYYTDYVYRQRNRYAHNLTSYQLNIPTFTQFQKFDTSKNNHFRMFSLLILLDEIFMKYYGKFLSIRNEHSY